MKFVETSLAGSFVVERDSSEDERGSFARIFSAREFRKRGLEPDLTEVSLSRNARAGTLRGMHFQSSPHEETKLVQVVRGSAYDVIVDLRKDSQTGGKWFGRKLDATTGSALYIPAGFAHGFLSLEDDTEVLYFISDTFSPEKSTGFRWDDPSVGIAWPRDPAVISPRDASLPHLADL